MTSISAIHFVCSCGRKLSAKPEQAGKSYACPGCSKMIEVPSLAVAASAYVKPGAPAEPASPPVTRFARWLTQTPTSFRDFFSLIAMGWALVAVVSAVMILIGGWLGWVGLLLLLLATAAALHQCWLLVHARQRVLGTKDLPLFWGLIRMIAWDPTEGVLILRNKQVHFSDDDLHDGNGGVRFLYSILGEELALRVPLEVQTLQFSDDNILTREYLSLRVRGSVKWRIHDIRKFYLLVSRELRSTGELNPKGKPATPATHVSVGDEHAQGTLNRLVRSAVEWLRGLAEEQTRITFSRVSSGLLIANRITEQLPEVKGLTEPHRDAPEEFAGTTASLASQLMTALAERVADYGILVQDISLEEVQFPAAILDQCVEACKTAYLPVTAQRKALAQHAGLQTEVELLGREAVNNRKLVEAAPKFALVDFVSDFLRQKLPQSPMALHGASHLIATAMQAETAGALPPPAGAQPSEKPADTQS